MRLSGRVRKLEGEGRRCDGGTTRLAPEGYVPTEADRCPRCGGCHVLLIQEVVVEADPTGGVRRVECT